MAALARLFSMLAKPAGPALEKTAAALSKLIGRPVVATAEAVVASAKSWIGNNPRKAAMLIQALTFAGVTVATDELLDLFKADGVAADDLDFISSVLSAAEAEAAKIRARSTGDGDESTIHGMSKEDYRRAVALQAIAHSKIEAGIRACGSLEGLLAVRACMFEVEDADFESFPTSRRWR